MNAHTCLICGEPCRSKYCADCRPAAQRKYRTGYNSLKSHRESQQSYKDSLKESFVHHKSMSIMNKLGISPEEVREALGASLL